MQDVRQQVKRWIPKALVSRYEAWRAKNMALQDMRDFPRLPIAKCDAGAMGRADTFPIIDVFGSEAINAEWPGVRDEIAELAITDRAGGVNPGDRRAIYYLVRHLNPNSVLEVGTHVGASTVHIVTALRRLQELFPAESRHLVTVDVLDVNDPVTGAWAKHGSGGSPADLIRRLDCDDMVTFRHEDSVEYLHSAEQTYDLIFLDGLHHATRVYREIPASLRVLRSGGFILLHDYFPMLQPLWADCSVIKGPYMAVERLMREGVPLHVIPLGDLPWKTKRDCNMTSLALLGRREH